MTDRCLPSFTNTTRKIRYYSFWAWAFEMLRINVDDDILGDVGWWYLMKLETAFMIMNKHRNPEITGMPGITGIPFNIDAINRFNPETDVEIFSKIKRATSYDAVQYSPSLGSLNVVKRMGSAYQILKYGRSLAKIFDQNVNHFCGYQILVSPKHKNIKWKYLTEMEQAFSLDNVSDEERNVFIEIIEQKPNILIDKKELTSRVNTTLLVLDAFRNLNINDKNEFLVRLWREEYTPPESLRDIKECWIIVEARRYYQLAIEAILSSFCKYINPFKSKGGDFDEFSKEVVKSFVNFKLTENKEFPFNEIVDSDKTLRHFIHEIKLFCDNNVIDEVDLADIIKKNSEWKKLHTYETSQIALILLLILYIKFQSFKNFKSDRAIHFFNVQNNFRHSFQLIDKLIKQWLDLPVSIAIKKIIVEFSLKLHLGVSQDKWLQTGNFTFRYNRAESKGFELLAPMEPNMTNNKILAYIDLITDLGMLKIVKDQYELTIMGNKFIEKYL